MKEWVESPKRVLHKSEAGPLDRGTVKMGRNLQRQFFEVDLRVVEIWLPLALFWKGN